jgi:signal transduction histidine kinase
LIVSLLDQTSLTAAVIHEVRRLLTPARVYAELALRQPGLSPDVAKSLISTIEAAQACDGAMECLIASRSDQESVPSEVASNLGGPGVIVSCRSISRVPLAPAALEIILSNLLENARRASRGQRICIDVSDGSTGNVDIAVSDTGIGMSEATRQRATLPFVSQSSSTGLGLAICQHLIEQVGGSIKLESRPGVGTVVTVSLPSQGRLRIPA